MKPPCHQLRCSNPLLPICLHHSQRFLGAHASDQSELRRHSFMFSVTVFASEAPPCCFWLVCHQKLSKSLPQHKFLVKRVGSSLTDNINIPFSFLFIPHFLFYFSILFYSFYLFPIQHLFLVVMSFLHISLSRFHRTSLDCSCRVLLSN